jgi:hypothetical protein
MSYATSLHRFADQSAAERASVFGAAYTSTDAEDTPNLQLCYSTGVVTGDPFRAALTTLHTDRAMADAGFVVNCHAAVLLRRSLGLTPTLDTYMKSLADGAIYHVAQVVDHPGSAEIKLALRRLES